MEPRAARLRREILQTQGLPEARRQQFLHAGDDLRMAALRPGAWQQDARNATVRKCGGEKLEGGLLRELLQRFFVKQGS